MGNIDTSTSFHVAIVLDRSGSMEICRSDAVGAVNAYLRTLAGDPTTSDARVTLVLFDSEAIDTVRNAEVASTCAALKADEFVPRGTTPLYDAVGRARGNAGKPRKPRRQTRTRYHDGWA